MQKFRDASMAGGVVKKVHRGAAQRIAE